ncbi:MAG: hypothetical protein NWS18_05880 [Schleiferiaceae bacterium]|jgi:hypothetical protein|nr:hypothetical protein [Schleiferiaceae bacterium]MDP4627733.1 hypothetical protein [Schleiferiaceae bacterium]MDP4728198.1 hypothetical protein [Schleiferiaceae bacterium]MDP4750174.1 hypothetical protein [Schleiferiaceae bacterium]MDP4860160.1 hypothetical protein [Schleiferiaceae bacterium]
MRTSLSLGRPFKIFLSAILPVLALGGCDRVYEEIQTTVYVRVDPPLVPFSSQYINGNYVESGQVLGFALRNYGEWINGGGFFVFNENVFRDLDIKYQMQLQDFGLRQEHNVRVDVVYLGDTVHHAVHPLRDSASVWNNPAEAIGTFRIR